MSEGWGEAKDRAILGRATPEDGRLLAEWINLAEKRWMDACETADLARASVGYLGVTQDQANVMAALAEIGSLADEMASRAGNVGLVRQSSVRIAAILAGLRATAASEGQERLGA